MVPELRTLDEASRLTGMSTEAIRKRFLRGQIEGISAKDSNDGKIRVRLTEGQLEELRRVASKGDGESPESGGPTSGDLPVQVLSRLADSLERRLAKAEEEATAARASLEAERHARDEERKDWAAKLSALTGELAALRDSRSSDRRAARAALERVQRTAADLQSKLDGLLAREADPEIQAPPRPGFLVRLFRR